LDPPKHLDAIIFIDFVNWVIFTIFDNGIGYRQAHLNQHMGFRYLVLGAGIGRAIAYLLATFESVDSVILADKDIERAGSACDFINSRLNSKICSYAFFDADKSGFDEYGKINVIVSALPAKYNYTLAASAIARKINFCDLGGVISITKQIMELSEAARMNGVSVIPDCGLMPGLGVMTARFMLRNFDHVDSVVIYVGGLPQKPRPPVFYQEVFHLGGLESLCYDDSPVLSGGNIIMKPALSDLENFSVRELGSYSLDGKGTVEAFITAGASLAPWDFQKLNVGSLCEKTVRWPGFANFVKKIPRENFISSVRPHINYPVNRDNPDLVWMKVELKGRKNGNPRIRSATLFDKYDPRTGFSAMERCTGFVTALIAQYPACCSIPPGVHTPDQILNAERLEYFMDYLGKKHFNIEYLNY